ncbi:MAG: S8 family serine peptidase, partial [Paramuribaculum sp.]|nr:S8 family serine peptidase [Paramuribaculum sp.]
MKNKIIFLLALAPNFMLAQSKIDLPGLETIALQKSALKAMGTEISSTLIPVMIMPATDDCEAALVSLGIETDNMGAVILADIPLNLVETVADMPEVRYVTVSREMEAAMDLARPASGVTTAQEGFSYDGATHSYDGTGVLVSLFDTGMDANHVNFLDADGVTRVKRLWWYRSATPTEYTPDSRFSNISSFTTDNSAESHATHVAGIMGGSYNGQGTYAYIPSGTATSQQIINGNIPYYGVATGSDLAFAVGSLTTNYILGGIQKIIEYAESQSQPVVVNLSLGTTIGPHDGSDAYSRQLAAFGKRGIICIAAGNDGDVNMSIVKNVTSSTPIRTMFASNTCQDGAIDIWGTDSTPLTVSWAVYNTATGQYTVLATVNAAGQSASVSASNSSFSSSFTGTITMRSDLNSLNNRFNVYTTCTFQPLGGNSTNKMALIVESATEQKVYLYGNSSTALTSDGYAGFDMASPANSINDACCAENVISVGSYTTRNTWGTMSGSYRYTGTGFTVGQISGFSGYGESFQGEQLPIICAPGAGIVSSFSRYYVAAKNTASTATATAVSSAGVTNYWFNSQGTSMACPYVTGVVGLWLQACPTLTYDEVVDVLKNSSTYSAISMKGGRWGYGKIDATAGLKYILQKYASVGQVWDDDSRRLVISPNGNGYDVTVAGEKEFAVELFDMQGRKVATANGIDGSAGLSTSGLN